MRAGDSIIGWLGRLVAAATALALVALGLLFLYAASAGNTGPRVLVGAVLVLAGVGIGLVLLHGRPDDGAVKGPPGGLLPVIRSARCPNCGRDLEDQPVRMQGAAAVVRCPACGGAFRLEEEPQW